MPTIKGRRWCFTINNPTPEDEQRLRAIDHVYLVWGREVAGTGTPHCQGFLVYANSVSFRRVRTDIPRGHIERARGTSQQAADYCKKDGDFVELGTFPGNQGQRTDIRGIISWLDEFIADNGRAPTARETAVQNFTALLRYRNFESLAVLRAPPVQLRVGELRGWQRRLDAELDQEADDRKVVFYVDSVGRKGKTWYQQHRYTSKPEETQLLSVGKRDDIAFCIDVNKKVFMFNVPRDSMQFLHYPILEQLKDRMVFSPKYASEMKILQTTPHVIVFSNEDPDETKMSADRYDIREIL